MMRSLLRVAARLPALSRGWLTGVGVGVWLSTVVMTWTLCVGTTLPVASAAVNVAATCLLIGATQSNWLRGLGVWKHATLAVGFAGWIVLSRGFCELATWFYAWWSPNLLSTPFVCFLVTLPVALMVFGPPLLVVGAWLQRDDDHRADLTHKKLLGVGLGLVLAPQTVLLWVSPTTATTCLVALCLLRVVYEFGLHTEQGRKVLSRLTTWWNALQKPVASESRLSFPAPPRQRLHASTAENATVTLPPQSTTAQPQWLATIVALLIGCGMAAMQRIWSQLFMSQIHWTLTFLGCLCLGAAVGTWIAEARQRRGSPLSLRPFGLLFSAVWSALALFGYMWWVQGLLHLNTYCETPWITVAVRTLAVALMILPSAFLLGSMRPRSDNEANKLSGRLEWHWLNSVSGYLAARWFCPDPTWTCTIAVTGLLACAAFLTVRTERRTWQSKARECAMPAGLAIALLVWSSYSPATSSRLLFSTQVFLAARSGEPTQLLPQLDATRLMISIEGRESAWTASSQQGFRVSIRRDGMPQGAFSRELAICPHSSNEIVPAILPLVLHHEPRSLLLLGSITPASLSACTAFPLERIDCMLRDPDALALHQELASLSSQKNPFLDDRVHCLAVDPLLGMRAASDVRHDVILCREEYSASPSDAGAFTVEFYRHVARHLDDQGVFAQQIDLADFGAWPLQRVLASVRSVFPSVIFVQTTPDKGLLLASPVERTWLDEDLARRAEAPHVRRLCSQVGWDWSVLLSLTSTSTAGVDALSSGVNPLSASNGDHLCRFPAEVLRWGPKSYELYMSLAPHSSALIAWLGSESTVGADVARRLSDMTRQRGVIQDHPDFYWAYRSELRNILRDEPRNEVVQASGGGLENGLHHEDQRRLDYLKALGTAATQEQPSPADVIALTEYLEPYDPLVSYFAHQEIAHLYARGKSPELPQQLDHLLHSVFYGPGHDRSVRNIVETLDLLNEHPELMDDATARFDCLNGLMELLKYRWQLRMNSREAASRFGPVDASQSLQSARRTLELMESLQPDTNVSAAEWQSRRRVLERHLLNEVETYRDRISRHVGRVATIPEPQPLPPRDASEFQVPDETESENATGVDPPATASGPQEETVQ